MTVDQFGDFANRRPGRLLEGTDLRRPPGQEHAPAPACGVAAEDLVRETVVKTDDPAIRFAQATNVEQHLGSLMMILREKPRGYMTAAAGFLHLILGELVATQCKDLLQHLPETRSDTVQLVKLAMKFIEQNYQRSIAVADVVRYIGLDRSYLVKRFRETYGVTIQDHLTAVRMRRAVELVQTTRLPMAAVAALVGYRSYEVFERRYQKVFGEAPRVSRRAVH